MSGFDDRLRRQRILLMLERPFLASSVAAFPIVLVHGAEWCPTMATDGFRIYVNPGWANELTDLEMQFVLAHEVMHCLLGHMDRRGDRSWAIWNQAVDYATNGLLVDDDFAMPSQGLYWWGYGGKSAETIYDELVEKIASKSKKKAGFQLLGRPRQDDSGLLVPGFDRHLDPDPVETAGLRSEDDPSESERRRLRHSLLQDATSKAAGRLAGRLSQELSVATTEVVDWRTFVAQFVSGLKHGDYSLYPFNKRHLWAGLFLPNPKSPGASWLVAAVDTSGSMSDSEVAEVLGEVASLRTHAGCTVTVIQCDAEIQSVEDFEPWDPIVTSMAVKGRGGTDFRPVFKWVEEEGCNPDALIYLTDGYGPAPDEAPDFPVLWVLTSESRRPAEWGSAVALPAPS